MIWTATIPIAGQISSSLQSIFLIPLLSNLSFASFPLSISRYSFRSFFHYPFSIIHFDPFPLSFSHYPFSLSFFHYPFSTYPFPIIHSPLSFSHFALLFCLSPASVASSKCSLMKVWARGDGPSSKTPSKTKAVPGGCRAYSLAR